MHTIEWAAGLFEGEGCIYKGNQTKAPHNPYFQLTLGMTDLDVVQAFADLMDCGSVITSDRKDRGWKTMYTWRVSKTSHVRDILDKLLPHFGNRRAHKALDILDYIECN